MNGNPVCIRKLPCACSLNGLVIERMTASSSATFASCGNIELTQSPDSPCCANVNGDAITWPFLLNWVRSIATGIGRPWSSLSFGLGSNESTCETPPDM